jgi:hypothetical protein
VYAAASPLWKRVRNLFSRWRPVKVKLTKRFAEMINSVDLSRVHVGEVLDLSPRDAGVLLVEGWALPLDADDAVERRGASHLLAEAADYSRRH